MIRSMLPVLGAVLLCAQSLSALAADSMPTANTATSDAHVRLQVEATRDQISGANKINSSKKSGAAALLDAPVDTDDAPAQEQRP